MFFVAFLLWCFIWILLSCVNLWGQWRKWQAVASYGRRFLSQYSWWSILCLVGMHKWTELNCQHRMTVWKEFSERASAQLWKPTITSTRNCFACLKRWWINWNVCLFHHSLYKVNWKLKKDNKCEDATLTKWKGQTYFCNYLPDMHFPSNVLNKILLTHTSTN